jgi:hypothetical protein
MAVALLLAVPLLALTIWAVVTRKGATRIALGVGGGLGLVVLVLVVGLCALSNLRHGGFFKPESYNGPTGEIRLPYKCKVELCATKLTGPESQQSIYSRAVYYRGDNGLLRLPAGSYQVLDYTVHDTSKPSWNGEFYDIQRRISVPANGVVDLRVGEPIVGFLKVVQGGDQMSVTFEMRGRAGEECRLNGALGLATAEDIVLRGFQVLSQSSQVLMQRKFEFDCLGNGLFSGQIPSNVKGLVKLRPLIDKGTLNIAVKDILWMPKRDDVAASSGR